jgi:WD40 repeat protein
MSWPTSQDYNEAIQNAATCMSDPELKKGSATFNALGLPVPRSGNFADVYQFKGGDGKMWAIKCFTRQVSGLEERYARIDEHLTAAKLRFTVGFQYLKEGIRIRSKWYPLLKMEWVEGFTLNDFVRQNTEKPNYLHALTQMWGKLAGRLREANLAHADLQHGNVLLVPGNTPSKLGLKLIDYDGMWLPSLASKHSGEVGHPCYQHPARIKDRLYNADVDRFPHLVIACALRATLVGGKKIWDQFENGDNLLFRESDLRDPAKASIFKTLWSLNDPILRTLLGHLALSTQLAPHKTPWLDEILFDEKRIHLSASEEKQVVRLLGIETPATPAQRKQEIAAAPAPMAGEFQFYADADDEDYNGLNEGRTRRGPARNVRRSSPNTLFYVGGGVLALALIVGVIALVMGDKKHTPVAHDNKNQESKTPVTPVEPDTTPEPNPGKKETVDPKPPEPEAGAVPFKIAGTVSPIAIPHTLEFLYVGPDETTLSWGDMQAGTKAKKVGQHHGKIRTLNCSPDGSKALTSTDEGDIFVWQLKEFKTTAPFQEVIIGPKKIEQLKVDYRFTVYQDGVVVEDPATKRQEAIPIGHAACEVSGEFKKLLADPENEKDMGPALTDEIAIFNDALTIQVFQGGVMFSAPTKLLSCSITHTRHRAGVKKNDSDGQKPKPELEETLLRKPNLRELTPVHKLKNSAAPIRASAIAPDNSRAVTIGEDDWLCVWDLKKGAPIRKFKAQTSNTVAFMPDGKSVLLGTEDNDAAFGIWSVENESREKELSGQKGAIRTVCVSSDGKMGYTSGTDSVLRGWELTGEQTKEFDRNKVNIDAMILRGDNRYVVFSDASGIHAWEPQTGKILPLDANPSLGLSFFDDGQKLLCTQGKDAEAGVRWIDVDLPAVHAKSSGTSDDASGFTKLALKEIDNKNYRKIALSEDGKFLCLLRQSEITIIDPQTGIVMKKFSVEGWVTGFAFGKERELFIATRDGKLEAWDWALGQKLGDFETGDTKLGTMSDLAVTHDQKQLIVAANTPMLTFLDTAKRTLDKRLSPRPDENCQEVILYPDDRHVLLTYPNTKKRYLIWDLRKNQEAFTLDEPEPKNVQLLGVSPNGKWIVGYQQAERGAVHIWDATTGKLQRNVSSIDTLLTWAGFSASGNYVNFWEFNGRRLTVHLDDGKVVRTDVPRFHPYRAAFSAKGNFVASVDAGGQLELEHMANDDPPAVAVATVVPKKPEVGFQKSSVELPDTIGGSCFAAEGNIVYVGTHKGILHLLEATTLKEIGQYPITKNRILRVAHAPKYVTTAGTTPERIYLMDNKRHIYQWDPNLLKTTKDFNFTSVLPNPNLTNYLLAIPPDGNSLILTSMSGSQPRFIGIKTEKETFPPSWIHAPGTFATKNIHRLVFAPDGKLGAAYADGKLFAWNPAATGKNYPLFDAKITADHLALVPETLVLVGAESSKLEGWNYTTGKRLWSKETHDGKSIVAMAPIPKSGGLVTVGEDQTIRVWDALNGAELATWKFEQPVLGLTISPDGKNAITQHAQGNQLRKWLLPIIEAKKP